MNKLWLLTKVLLKTSVSNNALQISSSKKPISRWIVYGIFVLCFVPIMISITFTFEYLLEMLSMFEQEYILVNLVLAVLTLTVFMLSLLQVPAVFYYGQDVDRWLSYPLKPYQILGAKFINTLVYQYSIVILVMGPLGYAMLPYADNFLFLPILIIVAILLPVFPLIVSSLIIMLLMNFVPVLKNKNTMNLIIGSISVILAIALSLGLNGTAAFSEEVLLDMLMQGNNSLSRVMFTIIPTIRFASSALIDSNLLMLLLVIVLNIAFFILYCLFAQGFYLNGAQGISESIRTKKLLSKKQQHQFNRRTLPIWSLCIRELKELLRTPPYLMNNILIAILMPVIMIGSLYFSGAGADEEIAIMIQQVNNFLQQGQNSFFVAIIGGFCVGVFSGGINSVSATSISRDAYQLDGLLSLPVSRNTIVYSKVLTGCLVSMSTIGMIMLIIIFGLKLPWTFNILFLFIAILATVGFNSLSIILDLVKPKLNWTSGVQAVKNNFNSFVSIMVSMIIPIVCGVIIFANQLDVTLSIAIIISIIILMISSLPLFLKLYQRHLFYYQ